MSTMFSIFFRAWIDSWIKTAWKVKYVIQWCSPDVFKFLKSLTFLLVYLHVDALRLQLAEKLVDGLKVDSVKSFELVKWMKLGRLKLLQLTGYER